MRVAFYAVVIGAIVTEGYIKLTGRQIKYDRTDSLSIRPHVDSTSRHLERQNASLGAEPLHRAEFLPCLKFVYVSRSPADNKRIFRNTS